MSQRVEVHSYIGILGFLFFIMWSLIPELPIEKGLFFYSIFLVLFGVVVPFKRKIEVKFYFIIMGIVGFFFYFTIPIFLEMILFEFDIERASEFISTVKDFRLLAYSAIISVIALNDYTEEKIHEEIYGKPKSIAQVMKERTERRKRILKGEKL